MRVFCPECLELMPDGSRLPYVCKCTQAVFTTKQEWLVPKKKQRASELRAGKDVRAKNAKHKINEKHRRLWRAIHLHTDRDRDWYGKWRDQLLKTKCKCASHFLELEKTHPISFESEQSFFESTIDMHNAVNQRLEKPICSMERAYMLWRHKRPSTGKDRCIVSVAVGGDMIEIAKATWPIMQEYANRIGADFIGLDNQTEDWWGLEKFRAGHFASQYEETLFVDADCVITDLAPDVFEQNSQPVCIHDDWGYLPSAKWISDERKVVSQRSGLRIVDSLACLNSGVVLTRKSAASVWNRPECNIGTTHCAEQIYVEHQIGIYGKSGEIGMLDSRWNWQWWFKDFADGLEKAYIVHFANAPNRLEVITKYIATQQNNAENAVSRS